MLFHFLFDIKIVFPICKLLSIHIFPTTSPSFLIKVFPDTDKQQTSEKTARTAKSCAEIAEWIIIHCKYNQCIQKIHLCSEPGFKILKMLIMCAFIINEWLPNLPSFPQGNFSWVVQKIPKKRETKIEWKWFTDDFQWFELFCRILWRGVEEFGKICLSRWNSLVFVILRSCRWKDLQENLDAKFLCWNLFGFFGILWVEGMNFRNAVMLFKVTELTRIIILSFTFDITGKSWWTFGWNL